MSLPIKTGFFTCKMLFNIFIFSPKSFFLVSTFWREGGVAGFL